MLAYDGQEERLHAYWSVSFNGGGDGVMDEREASARLEGLLGAAVRRRLISDVPLGVFLSGGVDSGSIVALMSEFMPASEIKTFSIGFTERSFDESSYARTVARAFGTDHHEEMLTAERMVDMVPAVWDLLDEPMADASIIPTYMLSRFTREHVTVALGGDGGDEIFAGYDPFVAQVFARHIGKLPQSLHDALCGVVGLLPASDRNMSFDFKLKQFLKGLGRRGAERHQAWLGAYMPHEQSRLLSRDVTADLRGFDPFEDVREATAGKAFRDDVDALIYFYTRFYMTGHILVKVDMASMAHALEVRAPFLDVELAEFVNRLPSRYKLRGFKRKYLLKKMAENKLPPEILGRGKKGFGIPLAKWLKEDLRPLMLEVFSESRLRDAGLFDPAEVRRLVDEHLSGRKDNRKQLWTLLCFEMWRERYAPNVKAAA
jgi:asparagine synthase (glutamine-hydrolysing)